MTNRRVCLLSAGDSAATAAVDRTIIRWRDCDGIGRGTGRHVEREPVGRHACSDAPSSASARAAQCRLTGDVIVQYRSAEGWFGSRLLKCGTVGSSELALVGDAICRVTAPLVLPCCVPISLQPHIVSTTMQLRACPERALALCASC